MLTFLAVLVACGPPPTTADPAFVLPAPPAPGTWPQLGSPTAVLPFSPPVDFGRHRVVIDPGHGNGENTGARTVNCTDEQDENLRVALHLAQHLQDTGAFEVILTRDQPSGPDFAGRKRIADSSGASVLLSIHADARGSHGWWSPRPGEVCPRNDDHIGFSVLWSQEGDDAVVAPRRQLARAVSRRMAQAGLPPYDGEDYDGLYHHDEVLGSFIDRRGLFILRRPAIPSVIIETGHALHSEEWARWQEPQTHEAFAAAVAAALVDVL